MLDFFRRYQRFFFIIVTVVIVISFSFFGTYGTLQSVKYGGQTAFTAVDGSRVPRQELEEMVLFLGTDSDDKQLFGGIWGPNFLNDGVISKDLLQTGLAELLAEAYPSDISEELQTRLLKEKRHSLYAHPQAGFISTENAWTYFAPDMKKNYNTLKQAESPLEKGAFAARVRLYLGEKRFTPTALKQLLRYQEKQYSWVMPDSMLDRTDLSLYGYHTLEDWFGPRFLRLAAEFIINSAVIAEQRGYQVTKGEAYADLVRNAEASYKQNLSSPHLGVANSQEYLKEQLRRMGMDRTQAVKTWQKVMLFRRLFHDLGSSVFVDPYSFQAFSSYAKEGASGDIYELPKDLRLSNFSDLQKFEVYLSAVAKRRSGPKSILELPDKFYSVSEVTQKTPELVQKKYLLEIAEVNKNTLLPSIPLKETWNWEAEEKNWSRLVQKFSELGLKKGADRDGRFAALNSLDDKTRAKVDAFARSALLDEHPEWIKSALQKAQPEKSIVGLQVQGKTSTIRGLDHTQPLIALLDEAPAAGQGGQETAAAEAAQDKLNMYSADGIHYYQIRVIERTPKAEIMTFGEANSQGVLSQLLQRDLEAYYLKAREENPEKFQGQDKAWKPLSEVQDKVAEQYFADVLKAIKAEHGKAAREEGQNGGLSNDAAAPWLLYAYVRDARDKLIKDPAALETYVRAPQEKASSEDLQLREPLGDQWKLVKAPFHVERSSSGTKVNKVQALALGLHDWSKVNVLANGDLFFYQKTGQGPSQAGQGVVEKVAKARRLLSDDAQQTLMKAVLDVIKEKHAISLEYLTQTPEMTSSDSNE